MRWDDFRRSDNVEDDRDGGGFGGGGGIGIPVGGGGLGIGTVVVLGLIGWALGIDPSVLIGGAELVNSGRHYQQPYQPQRAAHRRAEGSDGRFRRRRARQHRGHLDAKFSRTAASNIARRACGCSPVRSRAAAASRRRRWGRSIARTTGASISIPRSSATCETRFRGCSGKACEFAEAYVIAHEVGHHVQNLLGILPKAQNAQRAAGSKAEANRIQVRVELQADCFAGVWANHSNQRWNSLEPGDVEAALQTAAAIGDDRLQQQSRGYVVPDAFTHGILGAAPALVHDRPESGQGVGLQHFRRRLHSRKGRSMPGIDESRQFVPLKIAVLTVSDTRELADDKSGATLVERIRAAGHVLAERAIVKDEVEAIRQQVKSLDRRQVHRRRDLDRRHRLHRPRRDAGGGRAAVREEDGRLRDDVPAGERAEDRHLGDPDARYRRRRQRDLYLLPAGLARRLQGRLGRDPGAPARLPLPAVQFRRDPAAARRASAAAEGERRDGLKNFRSFRQAGIGRMHCRDVPPGPRFAGTRL